MQYKTVLKYSETLYIEKKSKFIASISQVKDEPDAIEFLNSIRKKYKDASHNCYAYQVKSPTAISRMSDDGEPSGTAGPPMLKVLESLELQNTIIIVTRYFGGTLLGTGGLIKAYTNATKAGIQSSIIIEKKLCKKIFLNCDYSIHKKIEHLCISSNYYIDNIDYTDKIKFTVIVELIKCEIFIKSIIDLTSNSVTITHGDEFYAMDNNGIFTL
jgi:uncharacterized YigZ family protein